MEENRSNGTKEERRHEGETTRRDDEHPMLRNAMQENDEHGTAEHTTTAPSVMIPSSATNEENKDSGQNNINDDDTNHLLTSENEKSIVDKKEVSVISQLKAQAVGKSNRDEDRRDCLTSVAGQQVSPPPVVDGSIMMPSSNETIEESKQEIRCNTNDDDANSPTTEIKNKLKGIGGGNKVPLIAQLKSQHYASSKSSSDNSTELLPGAIHVGGEMEPHPVSSIQWSSFNAGPPPSPAYDDEEAVIILGESSATVIEAKKVEEIDVEEVVERRLKAERMQGELVTDVRIDDHESLKNKDSVADGGSKSRWCMILLLILAGAGAAVGIIFGRKATLGVNDAASLKTTPPTSAPTTDECHFCLDGSSILDDYRTTVVSQSPFRTCWDIMNEMSELTRNDKECSRLQAFAAWKCGCPAFPQVPSNPTCTFCGPNEVVVAKTDAAYVDSSSESYCDDGNKWLEIVGEGVSGSVCDSLRLSVENAACGCEIASTEATTGTVMDECIEDLSYILGSEAGTKDTSIERTYVLCPNTTYDVGFARNVGGSSATNALITGGQVPLTSKSNVRILCGVDGKLANNCTIQNGEIGVLFTAGHVFQDHPTIDNVWIQGITFRNLGCISGGVIEECQDDRPGGAGISIFTPTNLTIIDCIFEDFRDLVIEYDAWRAQYPTRIVENNAPISYHGTVRIYNSIFRNNGWLKTDTWRVSDGPSGSSVISFFNKGDDSPAHDWSVGSVSLEVVGCAFEGNMNYNSLIDFDGGDHGQLTILECCFRNNSISQFSPPPITGPATIESWAAPVLVGGDDRRPLSDDQQTHVSFNLLINSMDNFVEEDEGYVFGGGGAVCGVYPKPRTLGDSVVEEPPAPDDLNGCVEFFTGAETQVCASLAR